MLWKLRLLWYRTDKGALAFALFLALIAGSLALALTWCMERDRSGRCATSTPAASTAWRAMYYEARGESLAGQYAVAEVTMNRKAHPRFEHGLRGGVPEEAFSWTSLGPLHPPAGDPWQRAQGSQRRCTTSAARRMPACSTSTPPCSPTGRKKEARRAHRRHVFYR